MLISPATDLHLQLKNSTHAIHQDLHHNPLLRRLTQRDCTRAEYQTILRVFFAFYAKSEARLSGLNQVRFVKEAPVLRWLQQDLAVLGETVTTPESAKQPQADFSQYLGYLYVKQGSTLGGQVLCRQLQSSIDLTPDKGLRFFNGYGEHTRLYWLEVLRYFEDQQAHVDIPTAVASACDHFRQLQRLLEVNNLPKLKTTKGRQAHPLTIP